MIYYNIIFILIAVGAVIGAVLAIADMVVSAIEERKARDKACSILYVFNVAKGLQLNLKGWTLGIWTQQL